MKLLISPVADEDERRVAAHPRRPSKPCAVALRKFNALGTPIRPVINVDGVQRFPASYDHISIVADGEGCRRRTEARQRYVASTLRPCAVGIHVNLEELVFSAEYRDVAVQIYAHVIHFATALRQVWYADEGVGHVGRWGRWWSMRQWRVWRWR